MDRVVLPALHVFEPDLIVVASGLDAAAFDPLARMMLYSDAYRTMTRMLLDAATELCEGRVVMCHEGGYDPAYVPFCALAVMEELSGTRTDCEDPFISIIQRARGQLLQPHQEEVIGRAAELLAVPEPPGPAAEISGRARERRRWRLPNWSMGRRLIR